MVWRAKFGSNGAMLVVMVMILTYLVIYRPLHTYLPGTKGWLLI